MLITTSLLIIVSYTEPVKYIAKLRDVKKDNTPIIKVQDGSLVMEA